MTFYPAHELSTEQRTFVDGGVVLNNPSIIAFIEAINTWSEDEIRLLSVGTGESPVQCKKRMGAIAALPSLASFVTEVQSPDVMCAQLACALNKAGVHCKYMRVSQSLPEHLLAMDDCSNVDALIAVGQAWMTPDVEAQLADFFH